MGQTNTIAVLGLGLMGASLALSLKASGASVRVAGYVRHARAAKKALSGSIVDAVYMDPLEAVREADLVVVCVPVLSIVSIVKEIIPALKPGAVVTDVGSTKGELARRLDSLFESTESSFVGSHPICGSEKTGIDAGCVDLYQGRLSVVCASEKTPLEAKNKVIDLWQSVGAEVVVMEPSLHDNILAATSHLPHMVAAALVRSVAGEALGERANFCGTGFRDTTRVASGSADMWVDIIDSNRGALVSELNRFHKELEGLILILKRGDGDDIREWLQEAANMRDEVVAQNQFLN